MAVLQANHVLRFLEHRDYPHGHRWEVRRGFSAIGFVRQCRRTGRYKYFSGTESIGRTATYEALTLAQLKSKIEVYG